MKSYEIKPKPTEKCYHSVYENYPCPEKFIIYNGKVYGEWYEEANIDYPEDLTLSRELSYLIEVGIEIGKQIKEDELKENEYEDFDEIMQDTINKLKKEKSNKNKKSNLRVVIK